MIVKPNPFRLETYKYAFDRCTPEQQTLIMEKHAEQQKGFPFSIESLAYDLLQYGSFEAADAERQRRMDVVEKTRISREKKLATPGYVYIYRCVIDGWLLHTFLLEPDKEHGYELIRYIWVDTGSRALIKELKAKFSGRNHGGFYNLNKKQVQGLLEIPSGVPPEPSPVLIAPEPIGIETPKPKKPRALKGYVYVLKEVNGTHYKIGRTATPDDRMKTFNVKLPFRVDYEILIKCDDMYALETELHNRYASKHVDGEWFQLSDDDLEAIRALTE